MPKRTSIVTWIIGGFFAFVFGIGVIGTAIHTESGPPLVPATPARIDPTVKAIMDKQESDRLLKVSTGASILLRSSKDPDSFDLREAVLQTDGTVCYTYRARNSFNAMLMGRALQQKNGAILVQEKDGNRFVDAWNKACRSHGEDYARAVTTIIHMK